jgi:hypothetical protein
LAAWLYDREGERWNFLLASPDVDSLGTRAFLEVMLNKVFKKFGDKLWPIELEDLRVVSPSDPRASTLDQFRRKAPGGREVWVTGASTGSLDDALVYPAEQAQ